MAEDSKAHVGERLTGVEDPKDPDGLLTVDDAEDGAADGFGTATTS